MPQEVCFRCNSNLVVTDTHKEITFYQCVNCKRTYAKSLGKSLTDRWLNPISLALYCMIYEKKIVSDEFIYRSAKALSTDDKKKNLIIKEVEEELNNPKQKLIDMLDLMGTEEIARDYLNRLVLELKSPSTPGTK